MSDFDDLRKAPSGEFGVRAIRAARGLLVFTAYLGVDAITTERYSPGDGDGRRKVSKRWAEDRRLQNGRVLTADQIAEVLENAERDAADAEAETEADKPTPTTEIDMSRTVRPELFHKSDVSGVALTIPIETADGTPGRAAASRAKVLEHNAT